MLPPKLEEIRAGIETVREEILETASGLSEEAFARSTGGEWSIAQVLEHMVIAETGASKVVRKMLKEKAGTLPPYPADDSCLAVRPLAVDPRCATKAPDIALPSGTLSKDEVLRQAAACREQTLLSLEMLSGADPRSADFPHPVFGRMNLYEWLYLIVWMHGRVHLAQIAAAAGIPGTRERRGP